MTDELATVANELVREGRGILAIDETVGTCTKRFEAAGIESTEESRRDYRGLLISTPGLGDHASGVILYDETIRQQAGDGTPLVEVLQKQGVMAGIKVDMGTHALPGSDGESVTEGLDGLRDRLSEYREIGARFTKWRAIFSIEAAKPSDYCIDVNAHALARYAALAQEQGLVPIVEPEVLMESDHDIERCREVSERVLAALFAQLRSQRCLLEGLVLKTNMVVSGSDAVAPASSDAVAALTVQTFRRCVPAAVPGVAFLSGGMSGEEACLNLNEICRSRGQPWRLTYSFGRALQYPALEIWDGRAENVGKAQSALLHRLKMSSAALSGEYSAEPDRAA